jgi:hypothetical protein
MKQSDIITIVPQTLRNLLVVVVVVVVCLVVAGAP